MIAVGGVAVGIQEGIDGTEAGAEGPHARENSDGVWQRSELWGRSSLYDRRKAVGKKSTPTAAIIDSQSIRTAEGGEGRGFDGAKQITGRKRLGRRGSRGRLARPQRSLPGAHAIEAKVRFGWVLQTARRPVGLRQFKVLPKRWIVERTFAWLIRYRRHSRDYERTTDSSEAMIYIAMINLMSRRPQKLKS